MQGSGITFTKRKINKDGKINNNSITIQYEKGEGGAKVSINTSLNLFTLLSGFENNSSSTTISLNKYMNKFYEVIKLIGLDQSDTLKDVAAHKGRIENPDNMRASLTLKQAIDLFKVLGDDELGNFDVYLNNEKYRITNDIKEKVKLYLLDGYEIEGIKRIDGLFLNKQTPKTIEHIIFAAKRELITEWLKKAYGLNNIEGCNISNLIEIYHHENKNKKKRKKREKVYEKSEYENLILGRLNKPIRGSNAA